MWRVKGWNHKIRPTLGSCNSQLREMGVSAPPEAASALLLQGTERGVLELAVSRKDILEEIWQKCCYSVVELSQLQGEAAHTKTYNHQNHLQAWRGTRESGDFPGKGSSLLVAGQPWRTLDSTTTLLWGTPWKTGLWE